MVYSKQAAKLQEHTLENQIEEEKIHAVFYS